MNGKQTPTSYSTWITEPGAVPEVLQNLHRELYNLLYKVDSTLAPTADAKGRPVWCPISSSLLGCIRHTSIIPWDDSINVLVLDVDFKSVMANCEAAGLGIQTDLFFGGRIYPYPPLLHGATQDLPFIDVFVYKVVREGMMDPPHKPIGQAAFSNEYTPPAPGDLILAAAAARDVWGDWRSRITQDEWGDGLRNDVLCFKHPKLILPKENKKWLTFNDICVDQVYATHDTSTTNVGDSQENEYIINVPDQFYVPCFANPHGYMDRNYGRTWSSIGRIQPSHLDALSQIFWSTTMVKFTRLNISVQQYSTVYDQQRGGGSYRHGVIIDQEKELQDIASSYANVLDVVRMNDLQTKALNTIRAKDIDAEEAAAAQTTKQYRREHREHHVAMPPSTTNATVELAQLKQEHEAYKAQSVNAMKNAFRKVDDQHKIERKEMIEAWEQERLSLNNALQAMKENMKIDSDEFKQFQNDQHIKESNMIAEWNRERLSLNTTVQFMKDNRKNEHEDSETIKNELSALLKEKKSVSNNSAIIIEELEAEKQALQSQIQRLKSDLHIAMATVGVKATKAGNDAANAAVEHQATVEEKNRLQEKLEAVENKHANDVASMIAVHQELKKQLKTAEQDHINDITKTAAAQQIKNQALMDLRAQLDGEKTKRIDDGATETAARQMLQEQLGSLKKQFEDEKTNHSNDVASMTVVHEELKEQLQRMKQKYIDDITKTAAAQQSDVHVQNTLMKQVEEEKTMHNNIVLNMTAEHQAFIKKLEDEKGILINDIASATAVQQELKRQLTTAEENHMNDVAKMAAAQQSDVQNLNKATEQFEEQQTKYMNDVESMTVAQERLIEQLKEEKKSHFNDVARVTAVHQELKKQLTTAEDNHIEDIAKTAAAQQIYVQETDQLKEQLEEEKKNRMDEVANMTAAHQTLKDKLKKVEEKHVHDATNAAAVYQELRDQLQQEKSKHREDVASASTVHQVDIQTQNKFKEQLEKEKLANQANVQELNTLKIQLEEEQSNREQDIKDLMHTMREQQQASAQEVNGLRQQLDEEKTHHALYVENMAGARQVVVQENTTLRQQLEAEKVASQAGVQGLKTVTNQLEEVREKHAIDIAKAATTHQTDVQENTNLKKQMKQAKEHFTKRLEAATVAVMKPPTPAVSAIRATTKDTTAAEKSIEGILGHRNIEKVPPKTTPKKNTQNKDLVDTIQRLVTAMIRTMNECKSTELYQSLYGASSKGESKSQVQGTVVKMTAAFAMQLLVDNALPSVDKLVQSVNNSNRFEFEEGGSFDLVQNGTRVHQEAKQLLTELESAIEAAQNKMSGDEAREEARAAAAARGMPSVLKWSAQDRKLVKELW